jgi:hypothetical protein
MIETLISVEEAIRTRACPVAKCAGVPGERCTTDLILRHTGLPMQIQAHFERRVVHRP